MTTTTKPRRDTPRRRPPSPSSPAPSRPRDAVCSRRPADPPARLSAADPLITPPSPAVWDRADPRGATGWVVVPSRYPGFAPGDLLWPAHDTRGRLVAPPDDHVLDHLAHSFALVDEVATLWQDPVDTVAVVDERPACDQCGAPARYDGHLAATGPRRLPAYLCPPCFRRHGSGWLGTSETTYLLLLDEVSPAVRDVCEQLCHRAHRASPWSDDTV